MRSPFGFAVAIIITGAVIGIPARAYGPPPIDCPHGTTGEIGGFCVPRACQRSADCPGWQVCRGRRLYLEQIQMKYAGPYPPLRRAHPANAVAPGSAWRGMRQLRVCVPWWVWLLAADDSVMAKRYGRSGAHAR
jgi:hypothetical protein